MTEPTDAELDSIDMDAKAIANQNPIGTPFAWRKAYLAALARAVLAKWGTPPAVAGERVDRADAVNLARNTLTQYDRAITKKGVRVLAEAVLAMDTALTAPQPTQPKE